MYVVNEPPPSCWIGGMITLNALQVLDALVCAGSIVGALRKRIRVTGSWHIPLNDKHGIGPVPSRLASAVYIQAALFDRGQRQSVDARVETAL